jgi:hypothetical protein
VLNKHHVKAYTAHMKECGGVDWFDVGVYETLVAGQKVEALAEPYLSLVASPTRIASAYHLCLTPCNSEAACLERIFGELRLKIEQTRGTDECRLHQICAVRLILIKLLIFRDIAISKKRQLDPIRSFAKLERDEEPSPLRPLVSRARFVRGPSALNASRQETVLQQSLVAVPPHNASASNELTQALQLATGIQFVRTNEDDDRHVGKFVSTGNELFLHMDFSGGRYTHLSYVCGVLVPKDLKVTLDQFIEMGVSLFDPATSVTRALKTFSHIQIRTLTLAPFKYPKAGKVWQCFDWNETKLNYLSSGLEVFCAFCDAHFL